MNKIYVCLDESGDFMPNSYSKSKSFIGGYACNESLFEKGKEFLELCNEKYGNKRLVYVLKVTGRYACLTRPEKTCCKMMIFILCLKVWNDALLSNYS